MKTILSILIIIFSSLIFIQPVKAISTPTLVLSPWIYDPQKICPGLQASWEYFAQNNSPFFLLSKPCLTTTPVSAGATIEGMNIQPLTQLGFDFKTDGKCGFSSPHFTVYTTKGKYYFSGCFALSQTDLQNGWTKVKFSNSDAQPVDDTEPWPGFGKVIVSDLELNFDEHGSIQIDNLKINDQTITGPTVDQQIDSCKNEGWLNYVAVPGPFNSKEDCVNYFSKNNIYFR